MDETRNSVQNDDLLDVLLIHKTFLSNFPLLVALDVRLPPGGLAFQALVKAATKAAECVNHDESQIAQAKVLHLLDSLPEEVLCRGFVLLCRLGCLSMQHKGFLSRLVAIMLLIEHLQHRFINHKLLVVTDE
jgi:hypothetical protein